MTDIKRLTELAGLKEYETTVEFVTLDRAAGDALSAYQSKNNTDPLEKVVQYYAMKDGVDYEDLLATVSRYIENPQELMPGGAVSKMGENNNERMAPISEDTEMERAVNELEMAFDEWPEVAAEWNYEKYEGDPVDNVIDNVAKESGVNREELANAFHDHFGRSVYDYAQSMLDDDSFDDSMDGDAGSALASAGLGTDEDYGSYGGDPYESADLGRMYEEYKDQLAFEDFEQAMQEAVTFAGGTPPEEREKAERGRLAQRFAPGAADIAGQVTDQPTEPHAKTVIADKEPWEYTGDLGSSLGLKQKIDPENYASVLSRDFSKWVKGSELKPNKTRTVYDKMNNKQIKSTVWNLKGRHEDIVAFQILSGSAGNFAPGVYVRKDSAPPEMIQRGRESGR